MAWPPIGLIRMRSSPRAVSVSWRQSSPVDYHSSPPVTPYYDRDNGIIYVSMTDGRAKTANLRRDPRAALECTSSDGRAWATAEGHVTLTGPGTDPDGPEVQALVDYYRGAAGEHPDWDEYRSVMVSDRRVLMALCVERVYGQKLG